MSPNEVLAGLDPEQREVALALDGPVVVLAGAGTGKTRAITHRIAHACLSGQREARSGLAVTFTARAASQMRERLNTLGVPAVGARTFHAAALSQIRYFWPRAVGGAFPELVAGKGRLVASALAQLGMPTAPTLIRDVAGEIEWASSSLILPSAYAQAAMAANRPIPAAGGGALVPADVARLISAYQQAKTAANAIDFEDVLLILVAIMGDRPDIADEIRKAYRWFTVDEYQDVTPLQEQVLWSWLGERDDVCVVGDASQTIYSFAGASALSLSQFARRWPSVTQIRLDRSYRSTPQIVATANALNRASWDPMAVSLRSQCQVGPTPEIVMCADEQEEAGSVARRILALSAAGVALREIAVLMRTNAMSEPFEAALGEAGIAYVMRGGDRFFSRPEVREAITRLRGAAKAEPTGAKPTGSTLGQRTSDVLAGMDWNPNGSEGGSASRERWESLAALVTLAGDLGTAVVGSRDAGLGGGEIRTLGEFVVELQRREQVALAPVAEGVTLATLHSAKGLEWDAVFIVGCVEGSLPIVHADTTERIDEERRLLYVGITRARRDLVLTWALCRSPGGRPRQSSRFLAQLGGHAVGATAGSSVSSVNAAAGSGVLSRGRSTSAGPVTRRAPGKCRVCRAGLITAAEQARGRCRTCPGGADPQLLEALTDWCIATAKTRDVPTFVVFTEVTLEAIAERKPRTESQLLAIPGIGRVKCDLYGQQLLELIASVADAPSPAPADPAPADPAPADPAPADPESGSAESGRIINLR